MRLGLEWEGGKERGEGRRGEGKRERRRGEGERKAREVAQWLSS